MLAAVLVLLAQFSFAEELTNNPIIKAVAQSCGDQVYDLTDTAEMNNLASCYQVAIKLIPNKFTPAANVAFAVCNEFKQNDIRRITCLKKFQESIKDPNLETILSKCPKEEDALVKCAKVANSNCFPAAATTMNCYSKAKDALQLNTPSYRLSAAENSLVNTVNVGCGTNKRISSTIISAEEVESQVNCYQVGMLSIDKRSLPTTYKLSLDICDKFGPYHRKVECLQDIAREQEKTDIAAQIAEDQNLSVKEKAASVSPLYAHVRKCMENHREKKSKAAMARALKNPYKESEALYRKSYECMVDEFQLASQKKGNTSTSAPANAPATR